MITPLGLGCAQLGNLYRAMSDDTAAAIVDTAWARGIRYFDTAPHYGLGLSERRLGAALAARPRDDYVLSTKVGRLLVDNPGGESRRDTEGFDVPATLTRRRDYTRDGVLRSLESSLTRLGVDRVDIAFVHDAENHVDEALRGALPALVELRDQGVLRGIGLGMNFNDVLSHFVRNADVDTVMIAGRYTLLEQPALDDLLPLCAERGVSVVAAGVFNSGILASPTPGRTYNYSDAPRDLLDRATRIAEVCARHHITLPEAAIALPGAHPAVTSVVLGASSPKQVESNADRAAVGVPTQLWRDLVAEGLLRADTPVPEEVG
ncbi:aldo/keto reductase [Actinophytocola xinjiangensis]|uniref:Aldo/keto reductase n=1 Tax=Actinophytocola xinjiangensis TaxID=485602 RepID=A0A7Z0WGB7_9PSEU|nr:aldo/keto reductase [Actinophytocola xinjiangensis]OLF06188.1 aldo/keto reductase [Actinophytocola xinjiangensis]